MMRVFLVSDDGRPVSAFVQEGDNRPRAFNVGDFIRINRDVDLSPHTIVVEGERGQVTDIHKETGLVTIQLVLLHWGLAEWFNTMWLIPFDTDDILPAVDLLAV